jgi:hypothetical protein
MKPWPHFQSRKATALFCNFKNNVLKINFETLHHSIKHNPCTWFVRIQPQNIGCCHKTDWIWRSVSKPQNDYPVAVETKLMESLKATADTAKPE